MTRIATVAAVLAMLAAVACSGRVSGDDAGGGAGGTSGRSGAGGATGGGGIGMTGLDRSKPISSVTEAERNMLCDWFAPMLGGYGSTPACAMALISAPPDKATCVAEFPSCTATIGQFEDCMTAIVTAQTLCTQNALTAAQTKPECIAVGAAGCFPP
jgi:hypothetical protein